MDRGWGSSEEGTAAETEQQHAAEVDAIHQDGEAAASSCSEASCPPDNRQQGQVSCAHVDEAAARSSDECGEVSCSHDDEASALDGDEREGDGADSGTADSDGSADVASEAHAAGDDEDDQGSQAEAPPVREGLVDGPIPTFGVVEGMVEEVLSAMRHARDLINQLQQQHVSSLSTIDLGMLARDIDLDARQRDGLMVEIMSVIQTRGTSYDTPDEALRLHDTACAIAQARATLGDEACPVEDGRCSAQGEVNDAQRETHPLQGGTNPESRGTATLQGEANLADDGTATLQGAACPAQVGPNAVQNKTGATQDATDTAQNTTTAAQDGANIGPVENPAAKKETDTGLGESNVGQPAAGAGKAGQRSKAAASRGTGVQGTLMSRAEAERVLLEQWTAPGVQAHAVASLRPGPQPGECVDPADWLRAWVPSMRVGRQARAFCAKVRAVYVAHGNEPHPESAGTGEDPANPGDDSEVAEVIAGDASANQPERLWDLVCAGEVTLEAAGAVTKAWKQLHPHLYQEAKPVVRNVLTQFSKCHTPSMISGLKDDLLAMYGHETETEPNRGYGTRNASLSKGRNTGWGATEYTLRISHADAAELETALDYLTRPQPGCPTCQPPPAAHPPASQNPDNNTTGPDVADSASGGAVGGSDGAEDDGQTGLGASPIPEAFGGPSQEQPQHNTAATVGMPSATTDGQLADQATGSAPGNKTGHPGTDQPTANLLTTGESIVGQPCGDQPMTGEGAAQPTATPWSGLPAGVTVCPQCGRDTTRPAPAPDDAEYDTGLVESDTQRDTRSLSRRRADALLMLMQRAVTARGPGNNPRATFLLVNNPFDLINPFDPWPHKQGDQPSEPQHAEQQHAGCHHCGCQGACAQGDQSQRGQQQPEQRPPGQAGSGQHHDGQTWLRQDQDSTQQDGTDDAATAGTSGQRGQGTGSPGDTHSHREHHDSQGHMGQGSYIARGSNNGDQQLDDQSMSANVRMPRPFPSGVSSAGSGRHLSHRPTRRSPAFVLGPDNHATIHPHTARQYACDAALTPMLVDAESMPLDVGRTKRLATTAILQALWVRDKGCTFPGCTLPPAWCQAHHIKHWADGGLTALHNMTLLCQKHHTHVHQQHLTATITTTGTRWHT